MGNDVDKLIRCITTLLYLFAVSLKLATAIATNKQVCMQHAHYQIINFYFMQKLIIS